MPRSNAINLSISLDEHLLQQDVLTLEWLTMQASLLKTSAKVSLTDHVGQFPQTVIKSLGMHT